MLLCYKPQRCWSRAENIISGIFILSCRQIQANEGNEKQTYYFLAIIQRVSLILSWDLLIDTISSFPPHNSSMLGPEGKSLMWFAVGAFKSKNVDSGINGNNGKWFSRGDNLPILWQFILSVWCLWSWKSLWFNRRNSCRASILSFVIDWWRWFDFWWLFSCHIIICSLVWVWSLFRLKCSPFRIEQTFYNYKKNWIGWLRKKLLNVCTTRSSNLTALQSNE